MAKNKKEQPKPVDFKAKFQPGDLVVVLMQKLREFSADEKITFSDFLGCYNDRPYYGRPTFYTFPVCEVVSVKPPRKNSKNRRPSYFIKNKYDLAAGDTPSLAMKYPVHEFCLVDAQSFLTWKIHQLELERINTQKISESLSQRNFDIKLVNISEEMEKIMNEDR